MKTIRIFIFTFFVSTMVSLAIADESREEKQASLDAACEEVRQEKLTPLRDKYIAECVKNEELPSQEECQKFYADYGERMGRRAPLYYDLPECVTAFNFQQGSSDPDS